MQRPEIPEETYARHLSTLRDRLRERGLDCIAIYGDREHYASFKYYLGFEPRFEEGLLVIYQNASRESAVLLGNECFCMGKYARIPVRSVLCPYFSLPGQPMDGFVSMEKCLREAGLEKGMRIGLAGWKLIGTRHCDDPAHTFCVPSFLVESLREVVGFESLTNATEVLIHPRNGLRVVHDVHEIAALEYGAALASEGMRAAWKGLACGKREMEIAACMQTYGQQLSCHVMFASGENTRKGLVSPGFRVVQLGDPISMSMGLEGGLSCRGAYAAQREDDLPEGQRNFAEEVACPYYRAVAEWYETIGIGVSGGALYDIVQKRIPHESYGWKLNPGHLISYEEWLSSGIAPGNRDHFCSGMLVQMDIIPSVAPFVSPNAEDGICLADEVLRVQIQTLYPQMWERFMQRRAYMREYLGICLKEEVLPMSNLAGRYSPYLLDLDQAFAVTG